MVGAMSRERELRATTTDAERRLWAALRARRLRGFKFRRQHRLGPFIADFVCIEHRLVIEADGGQHVESAGDARRTAWLEARGWRVLRFWNNDILANTEGVQEAILRALAQGSAAIDAIEE
jgi:very-short-patch-repair endonuclease